MKKLYEFLKKRVKISGLIFMTMLLGFNLAAQIPVIDGNPGEWPLVFGNGSLLSAFTPDPMNAGNTDDTFTSSADANLLTAWGWVTGSANDKTDIGNIGVALAWPNLYIFADRYAQNGTAKIGIWIFKSRISLNPDGTFSGVHTVGDLLITSLFTQGGGLSTITYFRWTATGLSAPFSGNPLFESAMVNSADVPVPSYPGWVYPMSKGGTAGQYTTGSVFEAWIDLSQVPDLSLDPCFATIIFETGVSAGPTSSLGDLVISSLKPVPDPPTGVPSGRCGTGTVILGATGCDGTLKWYDAATGGAQVGTGTPFTTPSISATTSYWVSCTGTNGCESDRTEVVATVNANPVATASSNSPRCVGTTLNLTGGPAGMATYLWVGPNSFTSSLQSPSITNVTTAAGGTYTLTVTDSNGCSGAASTTVVVNANPVATASSNGPICAGTTLNLTGGPAGMTTYAWTGPNSFTSSLQSPSITNVTVAAGGTYTLTVTNSNGCTGSASTSVVVNPLPTCSIEGLPAICTGSSTVYTAAAGMSAYAWTGPGGFSGSTRSVTVSVGGTYTVTITNSNGCQSTCSKALTVNPLPACSITGTQEICAGSTSVFTATADMTTYAWTGPGGFSGSTRSVTVSVGGTYTVTITNSNGCQSTCSRALTVNPKPTCSVTPTAAKICSGFTQSFTVVPAGGTGPYTVAWVGPGGFTSTATSITVGVGGTYTSTVTDSKGCVSVGCTGVLTVAPCEFCTYTQGFFGNQKGKACDLTSTPKPGAAFTAALLAEGNMVIGTPTKNITFGTGDAQLIQAILPGGGGSYSLLSAGTCSPTWDPDNVDFTCLDPYLKDRQHRLDNTLLAQTITLGLNLRIGDNRLGGIPLQSGKWLVTQDKKSCAENSGFVDPVCTPVYSTVTPTLVTCYNLTVDPYHYDKLDAGVICYMSKNGYAMTVQGLFNLANDALGGVRTFPAVVNCGTSTSTVTLSGIASTVDLINNVFDECQGFLGYWTDKYACTNACQPEKSAIIPDEQPGSLNVYPNPFNEKLTFEFVSGKDAFATLEIYNMMGQKVQILMSRQVEQGMMYKVDFQPSNMVPGILLYRLILDNDVRTGKVIYNK